MSELTELQSELLRVIKEFSKKDFFGASSELTNAKLIGLMKLKPNHENYISRILVDLTKKNRIKTARKQITGKGLKRIITLI
jgi:hypothetical protein